MIICLLLQREDSVVQSCLRNGLVLLRSRKWWAPHATVKVKLPSFCPAHPVFNIAALKHFQEDKSFGQRANPPAPFVDGNGHERYVVESVLSKRIFRGNHSSWWSGSDMRNLPGNQKKICWTSQDEELFPCKIFWTLDELYIFIRFCIYLKKKGELV